MDRAALEMARRYDALYEHGQLWCVLCNQRPGELPHLSCSVCIDRFRRGYPLAPPANDGGGL
jgi:hypothetical protein